MIVSLVWYRPPGGQQVPAYAEVPDACAPMYDALRAAGGNLSMETLSTGESSVTIEDREADDDYAIEIVPHGVSIEPTLAAMLERFDAVRFLSWKRKTVKLNQEQ